MIYPLMLSGVLKFCTIIVLLSMSLFMSINISFIYLGPPILSMAGVPNARDTDRYQSMAC